MPDLGVDLNLDLGLLQHLHVELTDSMTLTNPHSVLLIDRIRPIFDLDGWPMRSLGLQPRLNPISILS